MRLAKRMRLDVVKGIVSPPVTELTQMADEHFAVPDMPVPYWRSSQAHWPWKGNGTGNRKKSSRKRKKKGSSGNFGASD